MMWVWIKELSLAMVGRAQKGGGLKRKTANNGREGLGRLPCLPRGWGEAILSPKMHLDCQLEHHGSSRLLRCPLQERRVFASPCMCPCDRHTKSSFCCFKGRDISWANMASWSTTDEKYHKGTRFPLAWAASVAFKSWDAVRMYVELRSRISVSPPVNKMPFKELNNFSISLGGASYRIGTTRPPAASIQRLYRLWKQLPDVVHCASTMN